MERASSLAQSIEISLSVTSLRKQMLGYAVEYEPKLLTYTHNTPGQQEYKLWTTKS